LYLFKKSYLAFLFTKLKQQAVH